MLVLKIIATVILSIYILTMLVCSGHFFSGDYEDGTYGKICIIVALSLGFVIASLWLV